MTYEVLIERSVRQVARITVQADNRYEAKGEVFALREMGKLPKDAWETEDEDDFEVLSITPEVTK